MPEIVPRVALIHALSHSVAPVNAEFERQWPACVRMNLLDDSLSADLAAGRVQFDAGLTQRFIDLTAYALRTGVRGVLFTCSAFGPCLDAVAQRWPGVPILKPNEAMIARAAQSASRVALLASFAGTLQSMPPEFPPGVTVVPILAAGALQALNAGDAMTHDRRVVEAARQAVDAQCEVIALAQFSLARAASAVAAVTGLPVLTTVDSAVQLLRARVEEQG